MDKDKNINLSLHIDVVNVILASLSKMPYESVVGVIEEIRKQADPQVKQLNQQSENN